VWTTYFTTVWIWLYFLAQFLMRLATPLRSTLGFIKYALPVEQYPMRSVGQVMALVACAGYCLMMLPASTFGGNEPAAHIAPKMVTIEPGEFRMGDLSGGGMEDELPVHTVTISQRFAIGKYEVTFEEYDRFAKATGWPLPDDEGWGRGKRPVINVSWDDAAAYAEWLSEETGHHYRLPSEAEWEYATRAGTETKYWWGDEKKPGMAVCLDCVSDWEGKATGIRTVRVDDPAFDPNKFGLYHTAGNVYEWVQDCWPGSYEGKALPDDGSAWEGADSSDCGRRVVRGGTWFFIPGDIRSAGRSWNRTGNRDSLLGFRLAQDIE
jgi:formylglycine-generating enzyme required for sulfatase activity